MSDAPIDPVCLFHGKKWSEHEGGRCLYCCICFDPLTPDECWRDENGDKWDMCVACGQHEAQAKDTNEQNPEAA